MKIALGMTWCSQDDCFKFDCSFSDEHPEKLTRCIILSICSRIFDPLGFIQPFILQPKLIIQELCHYGLSWNNEVPIEVSKEWCKWLFGIKDIVKFSFPRCVVQDNTYKSAEMHVFFQMPAVPRMR